MNDLKQNESPVWTRSTILLITVAALGYFVDVYDLLLFSIIRVKSLEGIGFTGTDISHYGLLLHNWQMGGMLVGGIFWGILGDKKGRLSVLFGSIILYSLANLGNAFVHDYPTYALCRFLAGVGLAGELGAGISLVAETLPKNKRGIGTTIVASVGVFGAIVAAIVGDKTDWRTSYIIGGVMGLALLFMRVSVKESGLFKAIENNHHEHRGNILLFFRSRERFFRFLYCTLSGLPIWFVLGLLVFFSPELGIALGVTGSIKSSQAVFYSYIGLVIGDVGSGLLSQVLQSRKKAIGVFLLITTFFTLWILKLSPGASPETLYWLYLGVGIGIGYWAVLITMSSELFGTNLRCTVTTSVPNLVRGGVLPMSAAFAMLKVNFSLVQSILIVGAVVISLAVFSLMRLEDSFKKDLDFLEL